MFDIFSEKGGYVKSLKFILLACLCLLPPIHSYASEATGNSHRGKVLSMAVAGTYTYVEVEENGKKLWIAVMGEALIKEKVAFGDIIEFPDSPPMINFQSQELKRTFDSVIFSAGLRRIYGKYEYSIEEANKEIKANPNKAELYMNLAVIYRNHLSPPMALAPFQERIISAEDRIICDKALSNINTAIKLNSKSDEYLVWRAELNINESQCGYNNITDSISDYSSAINIKPDKSDYYSNRADAYSKINENDKMLVDASEALKLNPDNVKAYYLLGKYYANINDVQKAFDNYKNGLVRNKKVTYLPYEFEKLVKSANKYNDAIKLFSELIKKNKNNEYLYRKRAEYYQKVKNYQKAIDDYTASSKIDPTFYYNYVSRAEAYNAIGNKSKALADYRKACSADITLACAEVSNIESDMRRGDNWKLLSSSDAVDYYYEVASIRVNKDNIGIIWVMDEIKDLASYSANNQLTTENRANELKYTKAKAEIDCENQRIRITNKYYYTKNGDNIKSYDNDETTYSPVIPDTIGQALYGEACKKNPTKIIKKAKKKGVSI